MRTRFFRELVDAASKDARIVLLTGDLGFGVVEPFVEACPGQFVNAGVAEQNMTGLAAGIALSGGKAFTYSIANFPTLRCLEQIRNDIAYHGADVTVVAVGGGLAYGQLGMSHHATEDLAIMRAIPGLAVAAPGDPVETGTVVRDLLAHGGPAYLRLGKAGEASVHEEGLRFERGESVQLRPAGQVALLSTGALLGEVCAAADLLEGHGIRAGIRSFPWLDPLDVEAIRAEASRCEVVVTVEEHSVVGGLGSAVAEVLAETRGAPPLLRIALPAHYTSVVGDQQYLRSVYGLDSEAIARRVRTYVKENRGLAGQVR
jgi:transketolase